MVIVKIKDFRNHLSAYLKKVRNGMEVVISDGDTPIARLIPYSSKKSEETWKMSEPIRGFSGLAGLSFPPSKTPTDSVNELLAERHPPILGPK